jgi:pimeloyl-ACP methyl ester carboxylesterase
MLHYKTHEISKEAPWVVFVHGAGGSSSIWFMQIKEFVRHFNVLLVDLRGHGKSKQIAAAKDERHYNFEDITRDIIDVLDELHIEKAHFIGISLGTILIRNLSELAPERVHSMIMGGAIIRLNVRFKVLVLIGNLFKKLVPYMWLYSFFAWILMPKARHRHSRMVFVNEAKKVAQKEFMRWFKLTYEINPLLKYLEEKDTGIPTLYLMGEEDYMFLPAVEFIVTRHTNSYLEVIRNSGHVCNIDQPKEFNSRAIFFLKNLASPVNKGNDRSYTRLSVC